MFWSAGNPLSEIQFPIAHNSVANLSRVEAKPDRGVGLTSIVSWGIGMNAIGLQEQLVLSKFGIVAGFVNSIGFAADFADYRKARHIAGTISDVDHILKRYPTIFMNHLGIHIDTMFFVGDLIDLDFVRRLCGARIWAVACSRK